ncbi:cytochrome c oxidase assembly protein COX20, mitochondrial [Aplysia californica]|uniref:Cytochrome c oxidase assembly protein COX20, mitochondrial n=1 Tax=Aplysia californica TaxID=6500 RepID=A0ABM0JKL3_APLCA|nr:cytochrome c oxidase assembly protein COX20, mitochondrial [Aplysia californica]
MDSLGENTEDEEPGFVKRIFLIPCMRKSFMYGISGGISVGLGYFLFTSNVSKASKYGLGSYMVILFGTWGVCRYQLAQERFKSIQLQKAMQNRSGASNIRLVDPKDV